MPSKRFIDHKLTWWAEHRAKGNHIFYCPDCIEWTPIDDDTYHDAEECLECEHCGKMIYQPVSTYWQMLHTIGVV